MVPSAPTTHLSSAEINTISNWTKTSFHMTTSPRSWVCPKWFLRPWHIRRKPCTNLASRLTLSPNGPKRASTWQMSPRSTTGCAQNDFHTRGLFSANHAPILHRD
jgi:hypothetical protein